MNTRFTESLNFVLAHECVYAPGHYGDLDYVITEDVPGDGGGLTKFGIDQAGHPGVDIASLTLDGARHLYQQGEWNAVQGDALPAGWDTAAFDCCVNNGSGEAIRLLQSTLSNVSVDGDLGPKTLAALNAAAGRPELLRMYLLARCGYYRRIVANHPGDGKFLRGWLNRVNDLASFLQIPNWEAAQP
jgi:lysozyme family protein